MDTSFGEVFGVDYERMLLRLLLTDSEAKANAVAGLNADLYTLEAHSDIVNVINNYYIQYHELPTSGAVASELKHAYVKIKQDGPLKERAKAAVNALRKIRIATKISPASKRFILDKLAAFATSRAMETALLEGAQLWKDGAYSEIVDRIQSAMQTGNRAVIDTGLNYKNVMKRYKLYTRITKNSVHSPIGIPMLDEVMRGGLEPGTLGVCMGPTHCGKSLFLVNAGASAIAAGNNVLHVTMEISDIDTAMRYDSRFTGIPINDVAKNSKKHIGRLLKAADRIKNNLFIKWWGSSEASVNDLRALLQHFETKGIHIGLLVVDYLDLLVYRKNGNMHVANDSKKYEILGYITRDLRQLAKDFNCAIWTASQSGRSSYSRRTLNLDDVADSLEKVRIADVVIAMCQTANESKMNSMRLVLLKNRLGGNCGRIVDCIQRGETQMLEEKMVQATNVMNFKGDE